MLIYHSTDVLLDSPTVVALGCFDGVHIGHASVIQKAKQIAQARSLPLAVFTFQEPPRNFFSPRSVPLICTTEEKLSILSSLGVDAVFCMPLSREIFEMNAEAFVRQTLLLKLRAKHVVCGYNYTFGKNALGTPALIQSVCEESDVGLDVLPETELGGTAVSSSRIRAAISDGNVEEARALLGRPFSITSRVVDGQRLARKLGFPTVNVLPDERLVLPRKGVYLTLTTVDGKSYRGITNAGTRPTVDTKFVCVETHLLDFEGDLYGKLIKTEFLRFIRDERSFPSVDDLAEQVKKDINSARSMEI